MLYHLAARYSCPKAHVYDVYLPLELVKKTRYIFLCIVSCDNAHCRICM